MASTTCKIYVLTNTTNNKIYIGQTWKEKVEDRMGLRGRGYRGCPKLYEAIQKDGIGKFKYTVLELCYTQSLADYFEAYYIYIFNSQKEDIGYNIRNGGSSGAHSDDTRQKMALSHTPERKAKNSEMMKDRHATQGHPMQGKHHTQEAIDKISATSTGRKPSPASIAKRIKTRTKPLPPMEMQEAILNDYFAGIKVKDITNKFDIFSKVIYRILEDRGLSTSKRGQKGINNFTGKQHSPATKAKMKQSAKKTWSKRKASKLSNKVSKLSNDALLIEHLQNIKNEINNEDNFKSLCDRQLLCDQGTELEKYERPGYVMGKLLCRDDIEKNEQYKYEIEEYIVESSLTLFDRCYEMIVGEEFSVISYDDNILDIPHSQLIQIFTVAIKLVQNKSFL